jgi:hypothetical protein
LRPIQYLAISSLVASGRNIDVSFIEAGAIKMENAEFCGDARLKSRRRAFGVGLGIGAASLATSALAAPHAAALLPIVRARFGLPADWTPVYNEVNIIPWTTTLFNEGVGCTLEADGRFLVRTPGLYRIALGCDWVAQQGTDIDLRKIGIRRKRPGAGAGAGFLPPIDKSDDHLASVDVPGSDPPRMARYQGSWSPGLVAHGAMITARVTVSPPNIGGPGDLAFASHSMLCDAGVGAAGTDALIVGAKVVAPDTVRVSLYNPLQQEGVTVPAGALNVVVMSCTTTCGEIGRCMAGAAHDDRGVQRR